jgi:hypothetical protein
VGAKGPSSSSQSIEITSLYDFMDINDEMASLVVKE